MHCNEKKQNFWTHKNITRTHKLGVKRCQWQNDLRMIRISVSTHEHQWKCDLNERNTCSGWESVFIRKRNAMTHSRKMKNARLDYWCLSLHNVFTEQELTRRWDTQTWRDASSLVTYLPQNYDTPACSTPEYFWSNAYISNGHRVTKSALCILLLSTFRVSRINYYLVCSLPIHTRASANAEGPREHHCQLKSCKMLHKCSTDCIWEGLQPVNDLQGHSRSLPLLPFDRPYTIIY